MQNCKTIIIVKLVLREAKNVLLSTERDVWSETELWFSLRYSVHCIWIIVWWHSTDEALTGTSHSVSCQLAGAVCVSQAVH